MGYLPPQPKDYANPHNLFNCLGSQYVMRNTLASTFRRFELPHTHLEFHDKDGIPQALIQNLTETDSLLPPTNTNHECRAESSLSVTIQLGQIAVWIFFTARPIVVNYRLKLLSQNLKQFTCQPGYNNNIRVYQLSTYTHYSNTYQYHNALPIFTMHLYCL